MIDDQGWRFINDPNSNEFRDLEAVAMFYYYKYSEFEGSYTELKADAKELIQEIDFEVT